MADGAGRRSRPLQHVHISALHAMVFFLYVVILGTLWKLIALHLVLMNPTGGTGRWGRMMLFQYGG